MVQVKFDVIFSGDSLYNTIKVIERSRSRIAVVLSKSHVVIGTVTDGDVRRHLLRDGSLEEIVDKVMNATPIVGQSSDANEKLLQLLKANNIRAIPIVDRKGKLSKVVCDFDLSEAIFEKVSPPSFPVAVIMAGGQGKRLGSLTKDTPKPMLRIDGVPLLERQVLDLVKGGIERIFISINYLGYQIKEYFGDGDRFGIRISYLEEDDELGTGGALSLLPEFVTPTPLLVMNGDILTTVQYSDLLDTHNNLNASITIGAINYETQVPFGVVTHSSGLVTGIIEKPRHTYLCNAGIYAVSSAVLGFVPRGEYFNMTDLVNISIENGETVGVFPLHEYWSDIGTPNDLEIARQKYSLR